MKISTLIKRLEAAKKEHGDIQVFFDTKSIEGLVAQKLEYFEGPVEDVEFFIDEETSILDLTLKPGISNVYFDLTGRRKKAIIFELGDY